MRVALRPGYVLLKSPSTALSPVAALLSALAFPDGRGGDASFIAPGSKAGKAGFSFQGNDQNAWRLVRELGGAGSLHKLVKGGTTFELVTQDSNEIAQTLRATVGMPQKGAFEALFVLAASQLPSRRPRVPKNGAGSKGKSAPKPPPDVVDAQAKIAALQKELVVSKKVGDLQYRLDGMQGEMFAVETKLKAYEDAKATVSRAQQEMEEAPTLLKLGLAPDTMDRVKRYPAEQQKRDDQLARIATEREQAEQKSAPGPERPLLQDTRFLAGIGLGLVAFVGALFLEGPGRYVALLSIPAFGFAALVALRFIEELQAVARTSSRGDLYAAREKKVEDDFNAFASSVKAAFAKAGVESAGDFAAIFDRKAAAEDALSRAQNALSEMEADPDTSQAITKAQTLKAEQEQINQKLVQMSGGYIRDAREVERDIAKLEEALAPKLQPQDEFKPVETGPTELVDDPCPALLKTGADLFHKDVPGLWGALKDRCGQYLTALTDRRYHGLELDTAGRATVQAPGRSVPLGEVPPKDVDLIWLGLRLTLVEKYAAVAKVPLVVEDTFAGSIEEAKTPLLLRMLKHLGTQTQVLHVTPSTHNPGSEPALNL
ncbi:MAG: chromosome segregation protein SMC [Myxococcaceae bacterium]